MFRGEVDAVSCLVSNLRVNIELVDICSSGISAGEQSCLRALQSYVDRCLSENKIQDLFNGICILVIFLIYYNQ